MPPSNGHLLLPKVWRAARSAYEKACKTLRSKFPEQIPQGSLRLQPEYIRVAHRQPINRAAAIRQARSRQFSTRAAGSFVSYLRSGLQADRIATTKVSSVASNISRLTTRAPFASALRPNLTGGTLGRTAGGYTIGAGRIGGARYFSHGPAAPAQVINNVSMGVRAFFLSGQKARFDGVDPITGNKRYKAVSKLQDEAERKMTGVPRTAPGSFIDFQISPTITAFGLQKNLAATSTCDDQTLNSESLLDLLSADFARTLKDLAVVLNDLKRLKTLGDMPVILHDRSTIRVRFPGCDGETVERLCDEAGIQRGKIMQDEDFDTRTGADLALLFPFAPSVPASPQIDEYFYKPQSVKSQALEEVDWHAMMSPEQISDASSSVYRQPSNQISFEDVTMFAKNPWASPLSGYSSINVSELGDHAYFPEALSSGIPGTASEYEGSDGIRKFIAECDTAARY
ncbi:casein kinase II beta 2 subunit [Aspergillus indologenus CBS 114.80]|uniref:Casein kinase II beta 2 subunit n=1 Tax=Aspergillus indologenus CBS 114.80 TaxID=1450541 RepID=A0A2V5IMA5_9EURO|nr:casein kinase II beta 2 subunit [Aspergillus indologenus CBS 114.80]